MQRGGRSELIGKRIGGAYIIVAELGRGSFGDVYQARHIFFEDKIVAIKLIRAHLDTQEDCDYFIQEAYLLNKLKHPYILPFITAALHLDSMPYIVTEYASQGTLLDRLNQQPNRPLPLEEAFTILFQISQGLQHAHQQNIVHRDLKPANILFNTKGEALLADFGIALTLPSGQTIRIESPGGTLQYMAPEQFEGTTSMKSDIYSLGCIAYELFTGHKPIIVSHGSDWVVWVHQHRTQVPIAPTQHNQDIPTSIEQIILKALAKQRDDRPDISTFLVSLQRFVKVQSDTYFNNIPTAKQRTSRQWFDEGNKFYDIKRYSDAIAAYERAIRLSLKDADVYVNKGNALGKLARYEEAVIAYIEAIRLNSKDANVYYNLANTYNNLARYKDAVVAYSQTTTLNEKHINAYYNKGIALYNLKLYKEAITTYEQVIRLDPKHASAYFNKGNSYYCLEQYKDAVIAYDHAISLNPRHASAYFRKSKALEALGWSEQALQAREKAYQLGYTDK